MGVLSYWARVRAPFQFTTNWRLGHEVLQWSHSSFLVRRSVFDTLGGWDEVKVSADMEFIWRVQAAFGADAVCRIHPGLPLAFALDDPQSLTRNLETHVRTTYFGLRHYYREICRYWHRVAPKGLSDTQQALKWAMLPEAIKPGHAPETQVDVLLRLDCSNPEAVARAAHFVADHPDTDIGISHLPDPAFQDRRWGYAIEFPDTFFALLGHDNVRIACPEDRVQTGEVRSF